MKYLFVYNANSGKLNGLLHTAHKIISPSTYQCSLCALTFGNFSESQQWKTFREELDQELVFLHKNEFEKTYSQKFEYPVVLRETPPKPPVSHANKNRALRLVPSTRPDLTKVISAAELNQTPSLESLITLCKNRLIPEPVEYSEQRAQS